MCTSAVQHTQSVQHIIQGMYSSATPHISGCNNTLSLVEGTKVDVLMSGAAGPSMGGLSWVYQQPVSVISVVLGSSTQ